jgi:hypothetical protein
VSHDKPHPLAGKLIFLNPVFSDPQADVRPGAVFEVEDWADRVFSADWREVSNATTYRYAGRVSMGDMPVDDRVLYGRNKAGLTSLIHVKEVGGVAD